MAKSKLRITYCMAKALSIDHCNYSLFSCDVIIFQNSTEILVSSDIRPYRTWRFATFKRDRFPHFLIEDI